MTRARATTIGFLAVLLWSLLALFTVGTAPVPPFQLTALTFTIGGGLGLIWAASAGRLGQVLAGGLPVLAFGTVGLFGYHALYFFALRLAPPAEAGLIAYLWPLLIVLFSGLLPGERLRSGHVIGALVGFAGAALIVARGIQGFQADAMIGYALAFACALFWSGYSVLSRRLGRMPTETVVGFCLATAVLAAAAHLGFEQTVWPTTARSWLSIVGLGLGPVGLAFFVWDIGVKRGDIRVLGAASYAAPVLSTLALTLAGIAPPSWHLALAAALVTGGAILAMRAGGRG